MKRGYTIKRWSPEDIAFLQSNYNILSDEEIAVKLDRSPEAIQTKRMEQKLIKSDSFALERSKKTQFQKGHVSPVIPFHLKKPRRSSWKEYEIEFLKNNWETMTAVAIAKAIGRPRGGVTDKALNLGLKKSPEATKAVRRQLVLNMVRKDGWTADQLAYVEVNWATKSAKQIANTIGRSVNAVRKRAFNLGLRTDPEVHHALLKQSPNSGRYTGKPVGTITTRVTNSGAQSVWLKIAPNEWQQLSHNIWLKAGKSIPFKHKICFKDGDPTNCDLSNLELRAGGNGDGSKTAARDLIRVQRKADREESRKLKAVVKQQSKLDRNFQRKEATKKRNQKRIDDRKLAKQALIDNRRAERERLAQEKLQLNEQRRRDREIAKALLADKKREERQAEKLRLQNTPGYISPADRYKLQRQAKAEEREKQKAAETLLRVEQRRQARAEKERKRLNQEKEDRKKLIIKPVDLSGKILLQIDANTQVYIRPDQDPEAVKQKYMKNKYDKFEGLPPTYQF
jgi:hypothetical protein